MKFIQENILLSLKHSKVSPSTLMIFLKINMSIFGGTEDIIFIKFQINFLKFKFQNDLTKFTIGRLFKRQNTEL